MLNRFAGCICFVVLLTACGGGGGGASNNSVQSSQVAQPSSVAASSSNPALSSSSLSSSSVLSVSSSISSSLLSSSVASAAKVKISGTVTYDYVPHNSNHFGLNYSATQKRPVRRAVIQLIDASNSIINISSTDDLGNYEFSVFQNTDYKVRVLAQSKSSVAPTWNYSVMDNTSSDALYSIVGSLVSSGTSDSVRNLNAASGWDTTSSSYSGTRAAAPFAILDSIYTGITRFQSFGNTKNYPTFNIHWSTKNKAVDGSISLGEITTTYYSGSDIYVLGDANSDTDEYDPSPILHEFGHYIENNFFRSDSIGGSHAQGDSLDMRVSMSEGFANAFSGIMLDSPFYEDASGAGQSSGGAFNLSINNTHKGYYDEGSIESIFYNYYAASGTNKIAKDATKIFAIMGSSGYKNSSALMSIFVFYDQLQQQPSFADQKTIFSGFLNGQNIDGIDQYATNESNSAGQQFTLPIYKSIAADNQAANVCSSAIFGKFNKLRNSAFLKLSLSQVGSYTINALKVGGDAVTSKPEIAILLRGVEINFAANSVSDQNSLTTNLSADTYILEIYDHNNHDEKNTDNATLCFDITVVKN